MFCDLSLECFDKTLSIRLICLIHFTPGGVKRLCYFPVCWASLVELKGLESPNDVGASRRTLILLTLMLLLKLQPRPINVKFIPASPSAIT